MKYLESGRLGRSRRFSAGVPLLFALSLLIAGCADDAPAPRPQERYVLISHAPDSDVWWNTVKNAIRDVAADFEVEVEYRNPPNGDLADMTRLLEQAAAKQYAGVAFNIPDIDVLLRPAQALQDKSIPVATLNSGTREESRRLGAILHVGQPEYEAGKAAGERSRRAGGRSFLCVNSFSTNRASYQRCKGFADALGVDLASSMIDSGQDPTTVASKVAGYLRNRPQTQTVLTLGPNSAEPTLQTLQRMNLAGQLPMATFDLSKMILQGIRDGHIAYAIDQQPYLQGYIAVAIVILAHRGNTRDPALLVERLKREPKYQQRLAQYGLQPIYEPTGISSGPAFITRDNLGPVERYAGTYR